MSNKKSPYAKDAKLRQALSSASKKERHEFLKQRDPEDITPPHDKHASKQVKVAADENENEE